MRPERRTPRAGALAGQGFVELAILLPVLLVILIGVLDLGRLLGAYVTLTNAAREGARYGTDNPTDTAGIRQHVEAEANNSGLTITDSNIPNPVIQNDGTYKDPPQNTQPNQSIAVTVNYNFTLITTYLFAGQQNVPLSTSATMQVK
ncbi:MAG: pilus assembly protein [Chloroflexota bacterium]|nr:pilus assembly protein [Chloroflexota bacterium]